MANRKGSPAAPGRELSASPRLLDLLKARFEKNMRRHPGLKWAALAELGSSASLQQKLAWTEPTVW